MIQGVAMINQVYLLAILGAIAVIYFSILRCIIIVQLYRSRIPWAHWSSGISSLWILQIRFNCKEIQTIHHAHELYGPVIRLSPSEVSVNCVKGGLQTIYAGGFDKDEWYSNLFGNYGTPNMFSTTESKPHSARKRMMSNIYSKSCLQNSDGLKTMTEVILIDRLLPRLSAVAQASQPFDIYPLICASTMDFVTSYQFGLPSSAGFLLDDKKRDVFLRNYTCRHAYNYYPLELPRLTNVLKTLGLRLVPKWVDTANAGIETLTMQMCDGAARKLAESKQLEAQDLPSVYQQLRSAMQKSIAKDVIVTQEDQSRQQIRIASELLDHLAAGFDTSAITLVYFIHEISQRPEIQTALRQELRRLHHPICTQPNESTRNLSSGKELDSLPLLHATIQETLRLRAAIPGPQPRKTPPTGCQVGPEGDEYYVPPNTRISAQAHTLHRNPSVFPDPESWLPERWLEIGKGGSSTPEQLREMHRWFWAFGSGGRMCVGSNLAMYLIKYLIAAIYTEWRTVVVDDVGFQQRDTYTAPPTSGRLIVRLESVPWS